MFKICSLIYFDFALTFVRRELPLNVPGHGPVTLDPAYNEYKSVKENARCNQVFIVTGLRNMAVTYFDKKKFLVRCR